MSPSTRSCEQYEIHTNGLPQNALSHAPPAHGSRLQPMSCDTKWSPIECLDPIHPSQYTLCLTSIKKNKNKKLCRWVPRKLKIKMFREPRLESQESQVIQLRSVHDLAKYTYPEPSMRKQHDDHNRCPLVAITLTTNKEGKKANSKCIHGFLSAQAA